MTRTKRSGNGLAHRVAALLGVLAALFILAALQGFAARVDHAHADNSPAGLVDIRAGSAVPCADHADGHAFEMCGGALCGSIALAPGAAPAETADRASLDPHPGRHLPGRAPRPENPPPIAG